MSNKSFQGNSSGPGSRTRRKMSGERQQALTKNKVKELIGDMLIANGQREMLKRLVQSRLAQSGWAYGMRTKYLEYIKQKGGGEHVNVSHMIAETLPKGVETFPESVRHEIEELLWGFSLEFISVDENSLPPTENEINFSEFFNYQSRDAKPEPGIGYNVPTPELVLSRTPSPSIPPRPLTPQLLIPVLRPENIKNEIKDEPIGPDDEELSSNMDENEDDEMEDDDDDLDAPLPNHNVESEEEELMDV